MEPKPDTHRKLHRNLSAEVEAWLMPKPKPVESLEMEAWVEVAFQMQQRRSEMKQHQKTLGGVVKNELPMAAPIAKPKPGTRREVGKGPPLPTQLPSTVGGFVAPL